VASMRAISCLEDSPRGAYTGAIGFLAPPRETGPRARFSGGIRTVLLDARSGLAEYGVGGGITHDSSAEAEYGELLAKARVLVVRRPPFSLFETLAYDPRDGFRDLDRHLERLASSARYFGFAYDGVEVRQLLEKAVADETSPRRIRCTLSRDGAVGVDARPAAGADASRPVRVAIDDVGVDPSDPLLYHKTTLRERYDRAAARHPEVDDVLLVNDRGDITESTVANVAVRLGGRWFTPPLDSGLLPGTARAAALAEGSLRERRVTPGDLRRADAIALVSSVRGWRAAVLAGDTPL
jgi:para-aminobenzoate synthetase / 4-amino-4-deoxychorismate lyase